MSRTPSSSGAQKAAFYWKPSSFNAQHTRMGDVCEVRTRTQSVIDFLHSTHLVPCIDYSCQCFRHIYDYFKLVQSCQRPP